MKNCYFCANNLKKIDYKEIELLSQFTDSLAKILPQKETETCAKHQRQITQAIKRARFLALLPFVNQ